jgi:hypothetical protein
MKKIILTILFVLLAIMAIFYSIYRKGTTLNKTDKQFAITNTKEINRINIIDSSNNITLIKDINYWSLNKKEIRQDLINMLIGVSEGLDAISPVSHNQHDSIMVWLDKGTKLTFYNNKQIINSFKICKHNNSIYGILENSQNPYRLSLRGFPDIDLTKIYSANAEHWMMNLLLDLEPAAIKSIFLEYLLEPEQGFQIEKLSDNQFYLSKKGRFIPIQNTDPEIITEYLSFFNDIRYYNVSDSTGVKKEIIDTQKPFFHLRLCNINNTINEIWGYNKPNLESDDSDPYEFYATGTVKGIMLLKYNDFDPILVNIEYFLKK